MAKLRLNGISPHCNRLGSDAIHHRREFCRWELLRKPDRKLVGFCGIGFWRDAPDPEIGWWLARNSWGQGLATEAARAALHHAFEQTGLKRIISVALVLHHVRNDGRGSAFTHPGSSQCSVPLSDGVPLVRYACGAANLGCSQLSAGR